LNKEVDGVSVVVDVHGEPLELVEPSLVSAIVATQGNRVYVVSEANRDDLSDLAAKYPVEYRFGQDALEAFEQAPTLVLSPGAIVDPNYLRDLMKQDLPKGLFTPPQIRQSPIEALKKLVQVVLRPFRAPARENERRWERQNVSMKAWLAGIEGRCIDIHQHGGGFLMPKGNFSVGQRLKVELETHSVSGTVSHPMGVLTVRNVRPATASGETWRIGGELQWDSAKELAEVVEHAFVVERYLNPGYIRREVRTPVSIPASVAGKPAACIDLSDHGAAFQLTSEIPDVENAVPVELHLANGQTVRGDLKVRGVRQGQGAMRISGLVFWETTSWLVENTKLLYEVEKA
jgi:hypothetical protein